MLNKNRIKKVLYIDHTNLNITPIKTRIGYEGHTIEIYAIGHGVLANPIFQKTSLDLIIEDSHDALIGKVALDLLKKKYKFKGYHKIISLTNQHVTKIEGKFTEEEIKFLDDIVQEVIKLYKKYKIGIPHKVINPYPI